MRSQTPYNSGLPCGVLVEKAGTACENILAPVRWSPSLLAPRNALPIRSQRQSTVHTVHMRPCKSSMRIQNNLGIFKWIHCALETQQRRCSFVQAILELVFPWFGCGNSATRAAFIRIWNFYPLSAENLSLSIIVWNVSREHTYSRGTCLPKTRVCFLSHYKICKD